METNLYCSTQTLNLAKEKGFNSSHENPTFFHLQLWLLDNGYYVYPFYDNQEGRWTFVIREKTGDMWIPLADLDVDSHYYDTFSQAYDEALKFTIESFL